jgi:DNA polymerase-3 subunit epsilon
LEIGIVDADDRVLFESFVRPITNTEWPAAQELHGISPADVAAAPTLAELIPRLLEALRGKRVVIYNADFELAFLPCIRSAAAEVQCCMQAFAVCFGDWDEYHGAYRVEILAGGGRVRRVSERTGPSAPSPTPAPAGPCGAS